MEQFYASLWMLASAFLYSLQNVDAQYSGDMFGFWTVCFFRGLVGIVFSSFIFCFGKHDFSSTNDNLSLLVIRCFLGGATIITLFFSLLQCDLSTVTMITSTSSIWTAWIGNKVLPEKYKWSFRDVLLALWCIGGIVVMSLGNHSPTFSHYLGMICALLSALFQSLVNITIKYLEKEPTIVVAFWGMMGSVLLGLPGVLYEWISHKSFFIKEVPNKNYRLEVFSLLTTGILSVLAQYFKTYAIQHSKVMSVLVLRYMDVVFSIIWDIVLFHQEKTWHTFVGMAMVLSGCITKTGLDYYYEESIVRLPTYSTSGSISMETTL